MELLSVTQPLFKSFSSEAEHESNSHNSEIWLIQDNFLILIISQSTKQLHSQGNSQGNRNCREIGNHEIFSVAHVSL